MRSLVVIDDERLVVDGIRAMLQRIRSDISLDGFACDGLSGFDVLNLIRPQIVITDIRIPGMDGLSMIESLRSSLPNTAFILISGYQEFEYARKALALGVLDYIDKPITIPKLKAALDKAVSTLDARGELGGRSSECTEAILGAIRQGDKQRIREGSGALLEVFRQHCTLEQYKKEVYELVCVATSVFFTENIYSRRIEKYFPYRAHLDALMDFQSVDQYADESFARIIDNLGIPGPSGLDQPVEQVLKYINDNYNKDIGLGELADMVQMNMAYLSMLFKEKVGVSFIKYLTSLRLEKAKQLLLDGHKVIDVCEMVGYHNYRYFCDLFKRATQLTPSEFRQSQKAQ